LQLLQLAASPAAAELVLPLIAPLFCMALCNHVLCLSVLNPTASSTCCCHVCSHGDACFTEQHAAQPTSYGTYLLLLLLLLQVRFAQDQDFFYAQYALLFSRLAKMGHKNMDIMTVPGM
jgi:hypothetical protein